MPPQSQAQRNWYEKNKQAQIAATSIKRKQIRDEIWAYKESKGCAKCPETHPVCLEFHHTNPKEKEFSVATGLTRGYAVARLYREMQKCIILCANCHRKEHHSR